MTEKHHVIYVPGILDDIYHLQSLAVATWRLHGVRGHLHEVPWAGSEPWQPKFECLLKQIDQYAAGGHKVSLVGASAGASAVLNAYIERRNTVSGVVYICAKINTPETVSRQTYDKNPAFKTSLAKLQANLPKLTDTDKAKMLSLYSPRDNTVPHAATVIPGVVEHRLPSLRHGQAILYSLSLGASAFLPFLKQQASANLK